MAAQSGPLAKIVADSDVLIDALPGRAPARIHDRAAQVAAEVRLALEARGQAIATADYLIAGVCLARDGFLLTRNRARFDRVPHLALGRMDPEKP